MIPKLIFTALLASTVFDEQSAIEAIASSGQSSTFAEAPDGRVSPHPAIAPGPAPILSFRYFQDSAHHRFGNVDLMLDDAGH